MRKAALAFAMLAVLPLVLAAPAVAKGTTHEVTMELVAIDLDKRIVTLKNLEGKEMTVPVRGEALANLRSQKVKAGDEVIATCQDNEQGAHEAVTNLRPAKA